MKKITKSKMTEFGPMIEEELVVHEFTSSEESLKRFDEKLSNILKEANDLFNKLEKTSIELQHEVDELKEIIDNKINT